MNPRPGPYKEPALTAELHPQMQWHRGGIFGIGRLARRSWEKPNMSWLWGQVGLWRVEFGSRFPCFCGGYSEPLGSPPKVGGAGRIYGKNKSHRPTKNTVARLAWPGSPGKGKEDCLLSFFLPGDAYKPCRPCDRVLLGSRALASTGPRFPGTSSRATFPARAFRR